MNLWNRRIALVAAVSCLSLPALAAADDYCTTCRDPFYPYKGEQMPGIPLGVPSTGYDPSAIGGMTPWMEASNRSPGVGVSATTVAGKTAYADPLWPQSNTIAGGINVSAEPAPAKAAPAAKPAAKPAPVPVASR
jgi:hypothetical protein